MSTPRDHVGSGAYLDALETAIEERTFPEPDPDLVPELTEARFVARTARSADDPGFADRIEALREPVFEPIERFDEVVRAVEEEDLDGEEHVAAVEDRLPERAWTLVDYPGAPHDFVEAAEHAGYEVFDRERRARRHGNEWETYAEQRTQVEAVATGASQLAREHYDQQRRQNRLWVDYDSVDRYADVVAFNAALATERWLAQADELPRAP